MGKIAILIALLSTWVFVESAGRVDASWQDDSGRIEVVLPGMLQAFLAGGDRYLAANIAVFRSMMVTGAVTEEEDYIGQGLLQRQASTLNPYHEDNAYIAAAILPWFGQLEAAQAVLAASTRARVWDPWPPFYLGFNEYYFHQNFDQAAEYAHLASEREQGPNKPAFQEIAAKWYTHQDNPELAIATIRELRKQVVSENTKRVMSARIRQLEGLITLRRAAQQYLTTTGTNVPALQALIDAGLIAEIPKDPFGYGYTLGPDGAPSINRIKPIR